MVALPTPGGDLDVWADELNEFIRVSHNEDGTEKAAGIPVYLASQKGSKFDGTDDYPGIQAAIDAASAAGGGLAVIDAAYNNSVGQLVHLASTLRMKSGVHLCGLGSVTDIRSTANPVIGLPTSGQVPDRFAVTDLSIVSAPGDAIHFDPTVLSGGTQLGWSRCTVENVLVVESAGDAFHYILGGYLLESRFINCVSMRATGVGFNILATDNFLIGCTAAQGSNDGFQVAGNTKLSGCKAYGNAGSGYVSQHGGRCAFSGCESQDNTNWGFSLDNTNSLGGCISDTDGLGSLYLGGIDNNVDMVCEYGGGGTGQHTKTWVFFDTGALRNNVKIAGRFDFSDVAFVTGKADGNSVEAGGWNARSQQAYSASFTPAPYQYGTVSMTLTGNITIVAPTYHHVGQRLAFEFTQDATGGRTVTWPSQFVATWTPNTGAGVVNRIEFEDTGTAWEQRSVNVGLTSSALTIADTFNRGDGALGTSSSGATWTTTGTAPVISGNKCMWGGAAGVATIDAGRTDATVTGTVVADRDNVWLAARYVDDNNCLALTPSGLYQNISSVSTRLTFTNNIYTNGDVVQMVVSGGTVLVYVNGALLNAVRTNLLTGTKYGIKVGSGTAAWDNFSIT